MKLFIQVLLIIGSFLGLLSGPVSSAKSPEFKAKNTSHPRVRDLYEVAYRLDVNLGWWPYLLAQAERSGDLTRTQEAKQIEEDFERYHSRLVWMFERGSELGPLLNLYREQFALDQLRGESHRNNSHEIPFDDHDVDTLRLSEMSLSGWSKKVNQEFTAMRTHMHQWFRKAMREEVTLSRKAFAGWSIQELKQAQDKILRMVQSRLKEGARLEFTVIEYFMRLSAKLMERAWDEADLISDSQYELEMEENRLFMSLDVFRSHFTNHFNPHDSLQHARANVKAFWTALEISEQVAPFLQIHEENSRGKSVWISIRMLNRQAIHELKAKTNFLGYNSQGFWSFVESTHRQRLPTLACVWLLEQEREAVSE